MAARAARPSLRVVVVLVAGLTTACSFLGSMRDSFVEAYRAAGRRDLVTVDVVRPAEIDMRPYPRIAVGEFDGDLGPDLADALRTRLVSSGAFEVLDRTRLDQLLREASLARSRLADPESQRRYRGLRTALALLTGRAEGAYEESVTRLDQTCGPKAKPYACTRWTRAGTARTRGTLDLVDAQTGRIVVSRPLAGTCPARTEAVDRRPPP